MAGQDVSQPSEAVDTLSGIAGLMDSMETEAVAEESAGEEVPETEAEQGEEQEGEEQEQAYSELVEYLRAARLEPPPRGVRTCWRDGEVGDDRRAASAHARRERRRPGRARQPCRSTRDRHGPGGPACRRVTASRPGEWFRTAKARV